MPSGWMRRVVEIEPRRTPRRFAIEILAGVGLVGLATVARLGLGLLVSDALAFSTYYPAILAASLIGGWRVGALAVVLSAVAGYFFFVPPYFAFGGLEPRSAVNLGLFAFASGAIVWVTQALRRRYVQYVTLFLDMSEGFAVCGAIRDAHGEMIDYRILEMNPALQKMLGVSESVVGSRLTDGPVDARWLEVCRTLFRTGKSVRFDFHNPNTGRWHAIHLTLLPGDRMSQFFFDITERKRAEKRQADLFDELNHRVKNNLAVVSSMLSLQARSGGPRLKEQLLKAVGRVQAIAEVHGSLYRGGRTSDIELDAYLGELAERLRAALVDPERIAIELATEPAIVSIDQAISLGIIVNELVTNAAKHAYPPPSKGVVHVDLRHDGEGLVLSIRDAGPGLAPDAGRAGGIGMRLVRSLVEQVGGTLAIQGDHGAAIEVRFRPATAGPGQGGGAEAVEERRGLADA